MTRGRKTNLCICLLLFIPVATYARVKCKHKTHTTRESLRRIEIDIKCDGWRMVGSGFFCLYLLLLGFFLFIFSLCSVQNKIKPIQSKPNRNDEEEEEVEFILILEFQSRDFLDFDSIFFYS